MNKHHFPKYQICTLLNRKFEHEDSWRFFVTREKFYNKLGFCLEIKGMLRTYFFKN
jgi:hypothetical protein